jgi:hypothetical protein
MIKHSAEYDAAVVADSRKQLVRAVFDLVDPDATINSITPNEESPISNSAQVANRGNDESPDTIATLELNRWVLDGSFTIRPSDPADRRGQIGWEGETLSGQDGSFSEPYPYIEIAVSNIEILQAVTTQFSSKSADGYPTEFEIHVWSGDNLLYTRAVTNNRDTSVVIDGFTVNYPTRARLTIKKWSLPNRVVRVLRLLFGLYETWDTKVLQSVDILTEVTFSGLKIPYSTCDIRVENKDHRFDPYAPNTIFTSIEDRQRIVVELGLYLEDGTVEWLPGGTYYQQSAGWKLQDLTVEWSLVDVIGALTKRNFIVPETLPTKVSGWIEAIMASLGANFRTNYIVEDAVKDISITATKDDIKDKKCGEMLRFLCMAINAWPRQDFATGYLRVGKLAQDEGNWITLDNMYEYPEMSANDDIADITFKLDNNNEVTFSGNNTESEVSLSVDNPFIHTEADARKAVISCLFEYGGRSFSVKSRGNPSSECGDIQAVDTQFKSTISARLYKQQLTLEDGVMRSSPSELVQSPNDSMYQNKIVLTGSGTWTAPQAGAIKITLIGGGNGGMGGGGGNMLWGDSFDPKDNDGGIGGNGGKVFIIETTATKNQAYTYTCGAAGTGGAGGAKGQDGAKGTDGGATTFGVFTSANGKIYTSGLMDIQSGAVYAQKGADYAGTITGLEGSGGAGGKQGRNGKYAQRKDKETGMYHTYVAARATEGTAGENGKPGCVIVEW